MSSPPPPSDEIWIARDQKQYGPYPKQTALELLQSGELLEQDLAWTMGEQDWKPLAELLTAAPSKRPFSILQLTIVTLGALALLVAAVLGLGLFSRHQTQNDDTTLRKHAGLLGGTEAEVGATLGASTATFEDLSSSDLQKKHQARRYSLNGNQVIVQYTEAGKACEFSIKPTNALQEREIAELLILATGETSWRKTDFIPPKDNEDGTHAPSAQKYESGSGYFWALDVRNEHPMVWPWLYQFSVWAKRVD